MDNVQLSLPGISAMKISGPDRSLYFDALNEMGTAPAVKPGDLLFFSHNDGDHFSASRTIESARAHSSLVIGPPGIAYPLLADGTLPASQLKIVYPVLLTKPEKLQIDGIDIKVYQTRHFVDHEPDHISFLIRFCGRKIYYSGDSYTIDYHDPELKGIDVLVYSLVEKDVVEKKISPAQGAERHLLKMTEVIDALHPQYLVPNHLNCDWTVSSAVMKEAVRKTNLKGIVFLETPDEVLSL